MSFSFFPTIDTMSQSHCRLRVRRLFRSFACSFTRRTQSPVIPVLLLLPLTDLWCEDAGVCGKSSLQTCRHGTRVCSGSDTSGKRQ